MARSDEGERTDGGAKLVAMALDLAAAFPSISRAWIARAFQLVRAPLGLQVFIANTHSSTWALSFASSGIHYDYEMASGVQQGCPLAGVAFVVCFDFALRALMHTLAENAKILACADDIFLVLRTIRLLAPVSEVFTKVAGATALCLSPTKCIIVPLWDSCTPQTVTATKEAIATIAPKFSSSPVEGATIFLVMLVGPSATEELVWKLAMDKFLCAANRILASGTSPTIAGALLARRAWPTLG